MLNRTLHCIVMCPVMAFVLFLVGCAATPSAQSVTKDGVFLHIKSGPDHPHSVLMGLRMAQMMAADKDVLVYFDVDGINAVLQGAPDLKMEPFGSSHAMIQDLIDRKVPVYACPGCLKALGKTPEQLMPGIKVAEKQAFFTFTQGRILTLDY
jgi:predicted peroxiredoxin